MHHFNLYMGILQIHLKSAIINFRKGLQGILSKHSNSGNLYIDPYYIIFQLQNYIFGKWQLKHLKATFQVESFRVQIPLQCLVGQQQAEGSIALHSYKLKEEHVCLDRSKLKSTY